MFTLFFNKYSEVDSLTRGAKTIIDVLSILGGFAGMIFSIIFVLISYFQEHLYQKSILKKLFKVQSNILFKDRDKNNKDPDGRLNNEKKDAADIEAPKSALLRLLDSIHNRLEPHIMLPIVRTIRRISCCRKDKYDKKMMDIYM